MELEKLINLYIRERHTFYWLISFEEFVKDYVKKCDTCGEYFVTDSDDTTCKECLEHKNEEECQEQDPDWVYFEENKDHFVYGLY